MNTLIAVAFATLMMTPTNVEVPIPPGIQGTPPSAPYCEPETGLWTPWLCPQHP